MAQSHLGVNVSGKIRLF